MTTVQLADERPQKGILSRPITEWLGLAVLLIIGLVIRLSLLTDPLYEGDLEHFEMWINLMNRFGVFNFYNPSFRMGAWDRPYPQISTLSFDLVGILYNHGQLTLAAMKDPMFIILLKLIPVISDIALIVAVFLWLRDRPLFRWLIPGLLAIYPGIIVTSVWWGQYESPFILLMVLSLFALHGKRPVLAWTLFALAALFKQPAVVLGPVLLVLTFRRFGWKRTVFSGLAFGAVFAVFIFPFALSNGLRNALIPFLNASDAFPYLTNNAMNFWYVLEAIHKGSVPKFEDPHYLDHQLLLGPLSFKTTGLLIFGLYTLLIMIIMWRQAHRNREFVWATAMFLGYFLLLTQVHERYIYPAAILSLIAITQDTRMAWIALGTMWTFSYNVLGVAIPNRWPDQTFGMEHLALPTALLNVILIFPTVWFALRPPQPGEPPAVEATKPAPSIAETTIPTPAIT